jgi:hypothetical protein
MRIRPLVVALLGFLSGIYSVGEPATAAGRGEPDRSPPSASADLSIAIQKLVEADWIDQDRRFGSRDTVKPQAAIVPTVTTAQDAAGGCDGIKNGLWGFHVASGQQDPWWQVDLGRPVRLDRVVIYNRCDGRTARTAKIQILAAGADGDPGCKTFTQLYEHDGTPFGGAVGRPLEVRLADKNVTARVVRLRVPGRCSFALDEVEVYAAGDPKTNVALNKPADQISTSRYSHPGTMSDDEFLRLGYKPLVATPGRSVPAAGPAETPTSGRFTLAHTRDVVERARRLAARLGPKTDASRLAPLRADLEKLGARLATFEAAQGKGPEVPETARREIYLDAQRLKRRIAFANPLLDIKKLLFITRHDAAGVFHMCDQFYGCNARPGGGLYVLSDPLGEHPRLTNLLAHSIVENGRLRGKRLDGGAFLSPELSFDGKTVLFAHTQATAYAKTQGKETYLWGPEISYHIFKCNADGTGLAQLTDGDPDDFDPCFLPGGRVAFISERRGGYLRCGRHCPVYTIFSMRPDGSDIIGLSFHETHEWQPSVTNDGMLVYSRWDYVDRDTNIAHHIWTCFPDGRDPRSFHGNYPANRQSRPWMEMDIRAVPGSNKFVAVTGAHHGHAFGSLVLIDQRREDDGAMSQLQRLTPEVPFPESEGRPINKYMVYGTPWPLSEDDYLCVYDAEAANRGIYWIDRDGNKELIYRDPAISCSSPIPLRPRPMPPVIPDQTAQTAAAKKAAGWPGATGVPPVSRPESSVSNSHGQSRDEARGALAGRQWHPARPTTVAVMNVYDSDFPWPAGTKIAALRVIQVLPKATAPPNVPRIGVAQQTNARAVLGTVPVEADGSAHFEAPDSMPLYFQALDERGLAVQSMRSATYLHPGEHLTCQGCHERKHRPPSQPATQPLALRRPPSAIAPDVEGSRPFNYVRLVQPVLDRQCVACHREKKALDLSGTIEKNGFTRSYANLAGRYGFYFDVTNGSINSGVHGGARTPAGQFGARAAPLMKYLDEKHYGVKLAAEDFHRIALWLDCNSEFLGAYEDAAAQARGEPVRPSLQ